MDDVSYKIIRKLRHYLFSLSNPAYIIVDKKMDVISYMGDLDYYQLVKLKEGDDATNYLPCLIGIDENETTQIPFFHIHEKVCHIIVLPIDNMLAILLMDATEAHWQQQHEQQKANENILLKDKLEILTAELQIAQTELEQKNQTLEEESRLKAGFIANMSHEFRTPLTAILGYTQVLKDTLDTEDPSIEKVSAIERGGKYLLSLVENLLDQMRLEISDLDIHESPTDIKTLLNELSTIFEPSARKKKLKFKLEDLIEDETILLLDELRLRQILINLLGNSIKFTDTGEITLTAIYENGLLELCVEDTGKGIAKNDLENILKPFVRVEQQIEGAGLGLSITKQLIDAMHGTLSIESTIGSGSIFTVRINARPSVNKLESTNRNLIQTTDADSINILIAEDDDDLASLYIQLLEAPNVEIYRASTGADAVELAKLHKPDLIIMDLQMPIMGGKEATIKIRQQGYTNPILALSAATAYSVRTEALAAGCNGYIVKPIGLQNLLGTINAYLNVKEKNPINNKNFEVLQKTFRDGLKERLTELEQYYSQIVNNNMDATSDNNFHNLVHRISGTASFFKVGQIGSDAEYLDNHLNMNKENELDTRSNTNEYLLRLINSIKQEIK